MFRKWIYRFTVGMLGLAGLLFMEPLPASQAASLMAPTAASTPTPTPRVETLRVNKFTTSALTFQENEFVWVQASGEVKVGPVVGFVGPRGRGSGLLTSYSLVPNMPHGALLCRIKGQAEWSYCSEEVEGQIKSSGQLEFQVNDNDQSNNDPTTAFTVRIVVAPYSVKAQQEIQGQHQPAHQKPDNTATPASSPTAPAAEKTRITITPTAKQTPTTQAGLDSDWHDSQFAFKYPSRSGLTVDRSNSIMNDFNAPGFANMHMVSFDAKDFNLVFALANTFDEVLNGSVQAIQLGIATNLVQFINEEHLTLHDRRVIVFEMLRGEHYGIWSVVQLDSGEGMFMIAWIDKAKVDLWRDPIRAIVQSIDTPKSVAARKDTAEIYLPASTELTYGRPVTATIAYTSQLWTLHGKAGDVVQLAIARSSVLLQLQLRDPYSATVMFLPQQSPFRSQAFVLPYDGLYQLTVSAPPPLKTRYQLQVDKLDVPEVVVGVESQVKLRKDMPYVVFRGDAGRIATITAKDRQGDLPFTFYPAPYEERQVDAYPLGARVRLPYTGPYLVALATGRSGDGAYSVQIEQSASEDIHSLARQEQLQTQDDKLADPIIKAELVPGTPYADSLGGCLPNRLIPCRFLFAGKATQQVVITASSAGFGSSSPSIDLLMPTGGHFALLASEETETQPEFYKLGPIKLPVDGIYVVNIEHGSGVLVEFK